MRISDWSSDVCSSDLVPEAESNRALRRDWGRNRLEPPAPDCCQCSIVDNSGGFRVDYARCTDRSVGCDDEFDQYPSVLARLFRGDRIRSAEHTSVLQSPSRLSQAVFRLNKQKPQTP